MLKDEVESRNELQEEVFGKGRRQSGSLWFLLSRRLRYFLMYVRVHFFSLLTRRRLGLGQIRVGVVVRFVSFFLKILLRSYTIIYPSFGSF